MNESKIYKEIIKNEVILNSFWTATKREGEETKIAFGILRKMVKSENVTLGEKRFLKEHSMDLVRLIPLVLISEYLFLLLHHFNNTR
jgi:hypothetical protein